MEKPRPHLLLLLALLSLPLLVPGCSDDGAPQGPQPEALGKVAAELTKAERLARYEKIKGAAAARGIQNTAYLLAGIAYAETGLAHCWSEATWACKGPNSGDCGGGPVIAGAGDGPCANQQGGLGMFQFDAGTFTQTLAKYGNTVLTINGNVDHAINFVINMVKISAYTTNAETDAKALQWIASYDYNNSTQRDQWVKTVTHYYNGCKPTFSCWNQRYKHYNDSLSYVVNETGLPFWQTAAAPDWKATFVGQGFPFASQPFELTAGTTKDGYIELKNEGKAAWKPGEVFLGTTEPRDQASPLVAPGWIAPNRAATVAQETPPGAVGRFNFAVRAPAQPGDYPQFFGLLREGVAWFSDSGQGGPPDNQLQVRVTSVAAACPQGLGAAWVCQGDERVRCEPSTGAVTKEPCPEGCVDEGNGATCAGPSGQAGSGGSGQGGEAGQAGGPDEAGAGGSSGTSGQGGSAGVAGAGGAAGKGGLSRAGKGGESGAEEGEVQVENFRSQDEGCGCATPGQRAGSGWGVLLGLGLLAARRRRAPRLLWPGARAAAGAAAGAELFREGDLARVLRAQVLRQVRLEVLCLPGEGREHLEHRVPGRVLRGLGAQPCAHLAHLPHRLCPAVAVLLPRHVRDQMDAGVRTDLVHRRLVAQRLDAQRADDGPQPLV
jgi:MYXO-CTERM domain-containing protein